MVDSHIGASKEWARCLATAPIMKLRTTTTQGNDGEDGLAEGLGLIPASLGHRCRHGWLSSVFASFAGHATAVGAQLRAAIIEFCHRVIMLWRYRTLSLAVASGIIFSLIQGSAWGQSGDTAITTTITASQNPSSWLSSFSISSTGSIVYETGYFNPALKNSNGITTINNNGTISTNGFFSNGIEHRSSNIIEALNNNGTISTSGPNSSGIENYSTINTLSNSGTISTSGPSYVIINQGAGTITTCKRRMRFSPNPQGSLQNWAKRFIPREEVLRPRNISTSLVPEKLPRIYASRNIQPGKFPINGSFQDSLAKCLEHRKRPVGIHLKVVSDGPLVGP